MLIDMLQQLNPAAAAADVGEDFVVIDLCQDPEPGDAAEATSAEPE